MTGHTAMNTSPLEPLGHRSSKRSYQLTCPRCDSQDGFQAVEIQESDTGCLMLFFGGLIPFLLFDSSRRHGLECENCGSGVSSFSAARQRGSILTGLTGF